MSTTLFAAISILTPVHAWMRRVWPKPHPQHATPPAACDGRRPSQAPCPAGAPSQASMPCVVRRQHPRRMTPTLRVLRVADAGQSSFHGGRMVISGRMADVCAELDRLAAQEAALQAGT